LKNIAILGSGSWGTALAYTLSKNNNIILWSYFEAEAKELETYRENRQFLKGVILPLNIEFTSSLEKALEKSEIVLFAVPSFAMRQTAFSVSPFFNKDTQIAVSVAKGLEEDTLMNLSEVIEDCLPKGSKVCALSGPTHAEEVSKDIPTTIVCACSDIEVAKKVQSACMNDVLRVYTSSDIKGVELGGTIKNIIALCAGISDGIGYGDNTKAALMTRGMYEIAKLGVAMGGKSETFYGLSGMGDLIVTCTSMHSRNRRCGMLIGQGMKVEDAIKEVNMVVEGIKCLKAVKKAAEKLHIEMPILNEAYNVIYNGEDPRQSVFNLMTRDKKQEN
jgi:glycerol-3-phosphate dehydrogenase (NAD(P)+)